VPSEGAVHHGNGAFWLILAIMGILVIGPGLWFVLGGNRGTTPPPPAHCAALSLKGDIQIANP